VGGGGEGRSEGWPFILAGWALAALGAWGVAAWGRVMWVVEVPLLLLAVWLVAFFRDPSRTGPRGDQYVIAPADGRIVDVRVVIADVSQEPGDADLDLHERVRRARQPLSGNRDDRAGAVQSRSVPARRLRQGESRQRAGVGGLRAVRAPLLVRQIAASSPAHCHRRAAGDRATQGERMGIIRFGSRVDVFLPSPRGRRCG